MDIHPRKGVHEGISLQADVAEDLARLNEDTGTAFGSSFEVVLVSPLSCGFGGSVHSGVLKSWQGANVGLEGILRVGSKDTKSNQNPFCGSIQKNDEPPMNPFGNIKGFVGSL